ncbi:MAG TPA: hypothetical protein VF712_15010 [Thermoleophilaceae bacterium]|jgi:hypothetical protein
MYQLSVTNNSKYGIGFLGGNQVIPEGGGQWKSDNLGDVTLTIPTRGPLDFLDLGDHHIGGDSKETWGVLIAYQGEEIVGRYEGGGQLTVVVNQYYQVELSGMDLRQISLSALEVAGATLAVAEDAAEDAVG